MKILGKVLMALWSLFLILGLWFMVVFAKDLSVDFDNAVQHIEKIKIIGTGRKYGNATLNSKKDLVWIETTWNFILYRYSGNALNQEISGQYSSILWWEWNKIITGNYSVIVAWSGNEINGEGDTIIWWESNVIGELSGSQYSTILGWKDNKIKGGNNSVIVWWTENTLGGYNSVVLWSGNEVSSRNYSVALWLSSKNHSTGFSFLWTDGSSNSVLESLRVFAIWANSWVVINTDKAHSFAKLTLWGSMFVFTGLNDDNIVCSGWIWWWVLKVMNTGWQMCLCSCDGYGWNSMLGANKCMSICNVSMEPRCATGGVKRICTGGSYLYEWVCSEWVVLEWTWAYLWDMDGNLHWSCQTEDGISTGCSMAYLEIQTDCSDVNQPYYFAWVCGNDKYNCSTWELVNTGELNDWNGTYGYTWMCKWVGGNLMDIGCVKCETWYESNWESCYKVCNPIDSELSGKVVFYNNSNEDLTLSDDSDIVLAMGLEHAVNTYSTRKCVVLCDEEHGFLYTGGKCAAWYKCTAWNRADDWYVRGLGYTFSSNDTWWEYSNSNVLLGCQFKCDEAANYVWSGGECVKVWCRWEVSYAHLYSGSDKDLTGNVASKVYSGVSAALGHKCAYLCDTWYTYVENNDTPQCVKCKPGTRVTFEGKTICDIETSCGIWRQMMKRCMIDSSIPCGTLEWDENVCWLMDNCYYFGEVRKDVPPLWKSLGITNAYLVSRPIGDSSKQWRCVTGEIQKNQCQYNCMEGTTCNSNGECYWSYCPSFDVWEKAAVENTGYEGFISMLRASTFVVNGGGTPWSAKWQYIEDIRDVKEAWCYFNCWDNPLYYYSGYRANDWHIIRWCMQRSCTTLPYRIKYTREYKKENAYVQTWFWEKYKDGYEFIDKEFIETKNPYSGCYYTCNQWYQAVMNSATRDMMCVRFYDGCPKWDYANEWWDITVKTEGKDVKFSDARIQKRKYEWGKTTRKYIEDFDSITEPGCYFNCGTWLDIYYKWGYNWCQGRSCTMPEWMMKKDSSTYSCVDHYVFTWYWLGWKDSKEWYYTGVGLGNLTIDDLRQEKCYYECASGYVKYTLPSSESIVSTMRSKDICIHDEFFARDSSGNIKYGNDGNPEPIGTLEYLLTVWYPCYDVFGLNGKVGVLLSTGSEVVNKYDKLKWKVEVTAKENIYNISGYRIKFNTPRSMSYSSGIIVNSWGVSIASSWNGEWIFTNNDSFIKGKTIEIEVETILNQCTESKIDRQASVFVRGNSSKIAADYKSFYVKLPVEETLESDSDTIMALGQNLWWTIKVKAEQKISSDFKIIFGTPTSMRYSSGIIVNSWGVGVSSIWSGMWMVTGNFLSGNTIEIKVKTELYDWTTGVDDYKANLSLVGCDSGQYSISTGFHYTNARGTESFQGVLNNYCDGKSDDDYEKLCSKFDEQACVLCKSTATCPAKFVKRGDGCYRCMETETSKFLWSLVKHRCILQSDCQWWECIENLDDCPMGGCVDSF